jgi:predicted CxxxxCH...CXXCH cytochrome family protein
MGAARVRGWHRKHDLSTSARNEPAVSAVDAMRYEKEQVALKPAPALGKCELDLPLPVAGGIAMSPRLTIPCAAESGRCSETRCHSSGASERAAPPDPGSAVEG